MDKGLMLAMVVREDKDSSLSIVFCVNEYGDGEGMAFARDRYEEEKDGEDGGDDGARHILRLVSFAIDQDSRELFMTAGWDLPERGDR